MQTGGSQASINMTPMIDILLVLLIIFLVITPLKPVGLATEVPREANQNTPQAPPPPMAVIGIDAGPATDGQVLVLQDLLGTNPAVKPKFLRHYAKGHGVVCDAVNRFHADVVSGEFPSREESYA